MCAPVGSLVRKPGWESGNIGTTEASPLCDNGAVAGRTSSSHSTTSSVNNPNARAWSARLGHRGPDAPHGHPLDPSSAYRTPGWLRRCNTASSMGAGPSPSSSSLASGVHARTICAALFHTLTAIRVFTCLSSTCSSVPRRRACARAMDRSTRRNSGW